jgi:orotate phosphoribosyltransferase
MTEKEVLSQLRATGAILNGHFLLSSGRHSDVYAEKFRALEVPSVAASLGSALSDRFQDDSIDVVVAPAVGGIVLGFCAALALGVRSVFAERERTEMRFRRGFRIGPEERVLLIEDVITTGKSIREVIELVPADQIVGIGCLIDRSGGIELGHPLQSLCKLHATSWPSESCPLCAAGVPLDARGSRHLASS